MNKELPKITKKTETVLTTEYGDFTFMVYHDEKGKEFIALVKGDVSNTNNTLVRVHGECATAEIFHSLQCDCRDQLDTAFEEIQKNNSGVIVYLPHEGRGIGLTNKIRAYQLQEKDNLDTVQANEALNLPADGREYAEAASILNDFGIRNVSLLTNNPKKIAGLEQFGLKVKRIPIEIKPTEHTRRYLHTKKEKMGHLLNEV